MTGDLRSSRRMLQSSGTPFLIICLSCATRAFPSPPGSPPPPRPPLLRPARPSSRSSPLLPRLRGHEALELPRQVLLFDQRLRPVHLLDQLPVAARLAEPHHHDGRCGRSAAVPPLRTAPRSPRPASGTSRNTATPPRPASPTWGSGLST